MKLKTAKRLVEQNYIWYQDHNSSSGRLTIVHAFVTVGGCAFSASGYARRNPTDKPDPELGQCIACGRALKSLAQQIVAMVPALGLKCNSGQYGNDR